MNLLPLLRTLFLLSLVVPASAGAQLTAPLRPGDRINIRLPGENTTSELLEVDQRGTVTLPRIGPIVVTSMAPVPLADTIRARYAQLFSGTDITVLVLRRITVLGEVNKPGVLYLEPSASIRDAVAIAQGATPLADLSHVNLIRGDQKERLLHWENLSSATRPLESGDAIMIDRESWLRRNVSSLLGAMGIVASIAVALSR